MSTYNPDHALLYRLANSILTTQSPQSEITKSGRDIKIKTEDFDCELHPLRFRQVSLKVNMAPASSLSSPVILSQLLLAVVSKLAKNAGVEIKDQNFHADKIPRK